MPKQYLVQRIIGRRETEGKKEYLVKWKGYSMKENTWEPLSNLQNVTDLVESYEGKMNDHQQEKKKKQKQKEKAILAHSTDYEEEIDQNNKQIRDIRQRQNTLEFYVKGCQNEGWISVDNLKEQEPKLLCEFLLKHIQIKK